MDRNPELDLVGFVLNKGKGTKAKRSQHALREKSNSNETGDFSNINDVAKYYETINTQPNFLGDFKDRVVLRKEMLSTLQHCQNDEDMYDEFLERLINMEEDVVE